jgi:tRNA U34 2-thiouridine synthase MnmA/TrmU
MVRAIGLLSGGLDSTLACRILKDQGVDVIAVHFSTGFCLNDHRRVIRRRKDQGKDLSNDALRAGAHLDIPVEVIDISREYFQQVLLQPKYGYGSAMNPCLDCRIFMLRKAKDLMAEYDAQFVFTGEVLDQRPMSQHFRALQTVERESGLEGLLLRPLSAKLLLPTIPEKMGWVDREKLLGIRGRSRKVQMALAEKYGIVDYPQPAGGCCVLVDPNFARRLQDYLLHRPTEVMDLRDILLLKVGRHFRLHEGLKLIVGREESENNFLRLRFPDRIRLQTVGVQGPVAILDGEVRAEEDLLLAARITARYADKTSDSAVVPVAVHSPAGWVRTWEVPPAEETLVKSLHVG